MPRNGAIDAFPLPPSPISRPLVLATRVAAGASRGSADQPGTARASPTAGDDPYERPTPSVIEDSEHRSVGWFRDRPCRWGPVRRGLATTGGSRAGYQPTTGVSCMVPTGGRDTPLGV